MRTTAPAHLSRDDRSAEDCVKHVDQQPGRRVRHTHLAGAGRDGPALCEPLDQLNVARSASPAWVKIDSRSENGRVERPSGESGNLCRATYRMFAHGL
ncbi:hypothetical protein [Lichenifustis flavocetrariae]|uniref:Uncharacterized protein n=1 Tax=Lichenifustis flavocetrariae TaxID=2949735 RepID=A0AA41Z0N4_9HYPH|nr:hypothetical protein [Lichenifustis flavocetrariae]MCW6510762.1 hypothetical protein [Lichenifustis flavocetrariae]